MIFATVAICAAETPVMKPSKTDKCPVCGMFVYKYPDWTCRVEFKDGSLRWFDGPKDMFKYLLNPAKYEPGKKAGDVYAIQVTEYYGMALTDAKSAWFVAGSDVLGPMGHELIPFKTEAEAREFMKDHKGKAILKFNEVTEKTLNAM